MNAGHHGFSRPAMVAGGLALAAVAAFAPQATAGDLGPHNEQVALVNETNAQPAETKSHINGTAQVASYNGGYVVFSTPAALVPWDDNGTDDVYLRSRPDGATILVSGNGETPGNDSSFEPTISDDGRYVAFTTAATNLAKGKDTNGHTLDVVVRDMQSTAITRVSQSSAGFQREQNSFFPVLSGNGRFVSFQTFGSFGVKDDDNKEDVYLRNLRKGKTRQVSLLPSSDEDVRGGVLNGDVSDNGRLVTFGNSEMLWVRDMRARETVRFHHEPAAAPCNDGAMGSAGRPVISGNGEFVAFSTCATDLVGQGEIADVFRIRLSTGKILRVTEGNGHSYLPSLSRDGRFLGIGSEASNLVQGDDEGQPDAFRVDLGTGEVVRASQGPDGTGGNSWNATTGAAISGDGHMLVYTSYSQNLVPGDESDYEEVFAWHD
jgi:hypothetical protein